MERRRPGMAYRRYTRMLCPSNRRFCENPNIVSSRQLRAARSLEAGFNPRACRYWEGRSDELPTSTPQSLDAIEDSRGARARHRSVGRLFEETSA